MARTENLGDAYEQAAVEVAKARLQLVMLRQDLREAERNLTNALTRQQNTMRALLETGGVAPGEISEAVREVR